MTLQQAVGYLASIEGANQPLSVKSLLRQARTRPKTRPKRTQALPESQDEVKKDMDWSGVRGDGVSVDGYHATLYYDCVSDQEKEHMIRSLGQGRWIDLSNRSLQTWGHMPGQDDRTSLPGWLHSIAEKLEPIQQQQPGGGHHACHKHLLCP